MGAELTVEGILWFWERCRRDIHTILCKDLLIIFRRGLKLWVNLRELNNALLNDNVISEADIKLREEEIESIGKELLKIDEAYEVLSK